MANFDYRGWLQGDPNKAWALDYVGNNYNDENYGINTAKIGYSPSGGANNNTNAQTTYDTLKGYAQEYGGSTNVNGDRTGFSGGGGATTDPNQVALYDQAIAQANAGNTNLDQQRQVSIDNINSGYDSNLQRLLSGKNSTQAKYEGNQITTRQDNQKARSNVDFETGQRANALQRLLGSKGSGSSSAARVAAPYAAALEGTQQLNQVGDTFKQNMGALDTSWNDYNTEWNAKDEELKTQKANQLRAVEADVIGKRQGLLSNLAQLQIQRQQALGGSAGATVGAAQPYFDQVNQLSTQAADLGRQYQGKVNVADPNYKAPDLSKYDYNARGQIGTANAQQQSISPYLSVLLNAKDKKQNQV